MIHLAMYTAIMVAFYFLITLFVPMSAGAYALGAMGVKLILYAVEVDDLRRRLRSVWQYS